MEIPEMDFDSGGITEKAMDIEGVTSGSAGSVLSDGEHISGNSTQDLQSAGQGILNEIGESAVYESGFSETSNPDMEVSGRIQEHNDSDTFSSRDAGKGELQGKGFNRDEFIREGSPLTEHDFKEMGGIPSSGENQEHFTDDFHTVPRSRRDIHRSRKDDTEY